MYEYESEIDDRELKKVFTAASSSSILEVDTSDMALFIVLI